ncbi:hypothetical protein [Nostoc sp.]
MFIDTTRQIAETLYFLLSGVDCLLGNEETEVFPLDAKAKRHPSRLG